MGNANLKVQEKSIKKYKFMKTCYIICAGDADSIQINKNKDDIIIAADAGLLHCIKNNISPDLIIGDFDSLGFNPKTENKTNGFSLPDKDDIIALSVEKDDTDAFSAVKEGIKRGFKRFIFFGAHGGKRPEHAYANISLLAYLSKNKKTAFMDCGKYTITAITDSKITFPPYLKGNISVFSFDNESIGVYEKGLLYGLNDAKIENYTVTGISNSFIGEKSEISVKKGTLIIFYDGKPDDIVVNL